MPLLLIIIFLGSVSTSWGQSFGYVLQAEVRHKTREAFVTAVASTPMENMVIDTAYDGCDDTAWSPREINSMRGTLPRRCLLAYLSIGEAENYRGYWRKKWNGSKKGTLSAQAPSFLIAENKEWKGNFRVKYWHPAWQKIVLSSLDSILLQGFDGVYLDIVDGYEALEYSTEKQDWIDNRMNPETKRTYRQDMIALVSLIAKHAREKKPQFKVFIQNGQALLEHPELMNLINGIGAEDVLLDGRKPKSPKARAEDIRLLNLAQKQQKYVVLIEYPHGRKLQEYAWEQARKLGFQIFCTDRELTRLEN